MSDDIKPYVWIYFFAYNRAQVSCFDLKIVTQGIAFFSQLTSVGQFFSLANLL